MFLVLLLGPTYYVHLKTCLNITINHGGTEPPSPLLRRLPLAPQRLPRAGLGLLVLEHLAAGHLVAHDDGLGRVDLLGD